MNKDTLEQFGQEFQTKVLAVLIKDLSFLTQVHDIVDPAYFESDSNKWIVDTILSYFHEYKKTPTAQVFKVELNNLPDDARKVVIQNQLRIVGRRLTDSDFEYVKDKFLEFCRNQMLKKAIMKSVDLLEQKHYDEIKILVDEALQAGTSREFGHDWKEDVEQRIFQKARSTIATPWKCLNDIMDGGLANGELGVIAAPTGAGKSWLLAALGAAAMKNGMKVLQFTLELNDAYTGLRYDTLFTNIEPSKLKENFEKVKETISTIPGEIIIKYFATKTVNCNNLSAHAQQMITNGWKPDLVIVDYGDLLRSNRRAEARWIELGSVYEDLRALAGELNVPLWTASQTHRSSVNDDVIEADKIADSFQKVQTADFVMSLSRKLDDKTTNTGRIHVMKNRFGPDGITFPARINVVEGIVDVYDESSVSGIAARQDMEQSESIVKSMLLDKYRQGKSKPDDDKEDLG